MALASVLLSLLAVAFAVLGVFAVIVPVLGSVLSFAAPALALTGVVLGGVAISRAKQAGEQGSGLALTGVILNTLAFVPALLGALTCGVCSAVVAGAGQGGGLQPNVQFQVRQGAHDLDAADAGRLMPPPMPAAPTPVPTRDGGVAAPPAPAPAMPPPPLNPGPGGP